MHTPFARLFVALFAALFSALLAQQAVAQDAGKVPGLDESKIPDWVKRQAASPQKTIINSTAVRPKAELPKPEAVTVRPVRQANRRQTPTATERTAAEPGQRGNAQVDPPVTAAPAASAPALASELTELPEAAEATPAPPVAEAASAPLPTQTQPPPIEVAAPVPVQTEPAPEPTFAPAPAPALVLLDKVDPVLTPDLLDNRLTDASVTVSFIVGMQGEVINPQITASSDRRLNRNVLRAVSEWRYAPISEPRPHSVMFNFALDK
ncbi:MAG: TonB family protein [Burkholderiales bacterium]|nr:TonB family protein [Burkholderiales bacterium]